MKFQRKYWGLLSTLGVSSAVALSACAAQARDVYVTSSASDLLKNNSVPMSMFNVSPTSSFFGSKYAGLTTYIATGSNKDDGVNVATQTQEKLVLELATSVKGYKKKDKATSSQKTSTNSSCTTTSSGTSTSGEDDWECIGEIKRQSSSNGQNNQQSKSITEEEKFQEISQKATRYEFAIDTGIKWVDNNGKPVKDASGNDVKLSSKDFERGFEAYILSSELRFNRNGYFIDLMGLDVKKTVGMTKKNGAQVQMKVASSDEKDGEEKTVKITDDAYNPEDYQSTDDSKFNVYLTSPFPFLLSMMSKEFFFPIPHTHPKVKAIKVGKDSPLVYNEKNGSKILDQTKTNFDGIYGGGVNAWRDTWSVGPYYVESFNQSQIVFKRNSEYDTHITPNLPKTREDNEKPIPTMINYFQPGATPEVFYSNYIAGGLSSAEVPYSQQEDARSRFAGTGDLRWVKVQKTAQSAQITYSSRPYVVEGETVKTNSNITETEAKFLYNSESEEALTIRAGINGLINWQNLAIILLPNSGDLNYSIVPFGIFKEKGKNGASVQQKAVSTTEGPDLMNDYYYKIEKEQRLGLIPQREGNYEKNKNVLESATVKINYYSSKATSGQAGAAASAAFAKNNNTSDNTQQNQTSSVEAKSVNVTKHSFVQALKKVGFSGSNPLHFNMKLGNSSLSANGVDYYNAVKQALTELGTADNGEKLIVPEIILGDAQGPTRNEWYIGLSSVLGFSSWSPDYDGVGTWLDAATQLNDQGGGDVITYSSGAHIVRTLLLAASQKDVHSKFTQKIDQQNTASTTSDVTVKKADSSQDSSKSNTEEEKWDDVTSADLFKDDPYVLKNFGDAKAQAAQRSTGSTTSGNGTQASLEFTKKALSLLKFLVDNGILDKEKVKEAIKDPNKYLGKRDKIENGTNKPSKNEDFIGYELKDIYKKAAQLNRFNSIWAEKDTDNAKFLITVVDSYFPVLPVPAAGLNETSPTLLKPWFQFRSAPSGNGTIRDYGFIPENK